MRPASAGSVCRDVEGTEPGRHANHPGLEPEVRLAKAEGVAEVASVGGFVKQYNVILDPQRMRDLGITMQKMRDAIRASNADVGGRTVELSEFEYVIRGKGYIKSINDLGDIVLKVNNGTPVLLRDVTRVDLLPDERRGVTELNGGR